MEFNKLVFAGLSVGCLTAAAGGSYLAVRQNQASVGAIGAESAHGAVVPGASLGTSAPAAPNAPVTESEGVISPEPVRPARDRKSTRLNSSHSQISYAVFCLKKKRRR